MNTSFRGTFAKVSVELTEEGWEYLSKHFPNASAGEKLRAVIVMAEYSMRNDPRLKPIDVEGEDVTDE